MDSNQRSESNNQTNNGGNEKGTPGAKGNTRSGPMDHTYPQGAAQQATTQQSGAGPGLGNERQQGLPGGSMQTQQSGGTGAVQGITDSHQRAMEQRSGAYGQIEQFGSGAPRQDNTAGSQQSGTQGGGQAGPLSEQRRVDTGSMGSQQSGMGTGSQAGGRVGRSMEHDTGRPAVKQSGSMSAQQTSDRSGSQTGGSEQRDAARDATRDATRDADRMHQSNDSAGGLPRSPGGTGPTHARQDSHLTGAQVHANQQKAEGGVHKSNDMAGGLPKSPGGANKLAADEKMDDDTGFSNR